MRITDEIIEEAVLQLFVDCAITAGDSLPFRRLRADWPRSKLRRSDLLQGIKGLVFKGDLELEDDHEGGVFTLTPQGYQRAIALSSRRPIKWNQLVSQALSRFKPTQDVDLQPVAPEILPQTFSKTLPQAKPRVR